MLVEASKPMTKLYVMLFQEKKKNEDFHKGHCTKEMNNLLKVQRIYLDSESLKVLVVDIYCGLSKWY